MSFDSLGLSAELQKAVAQQGYTTPTPIQQQAIPAVLQGRDLMASAQTGTGKTAAFTLPMLQRLMDGASGAQRRIRTLVLAPTRELADQVNESVRDYGRHLPLRAVEIYGGAPMGKQTAALRKGVDIVVATPGRLIDHMDRGNIDLSHVEMLVLDEADRMLDMGFKPAIERIIKTMPKQRQTLLFSATFAGAVGKLAQNFLNNPEVIETARANATATNVEQAAYLVDSGRKRALLTQVIKDENWHQVLVFARTKHGSDRLAKQLEQDGIKSTSIHGDKSQGQRKRALEQFKRKQVQVLVATDVAARGIDIDGLPYVVNFDMPTNPEDYVHRIGRTGRGGESGHAWSLVCADEQGQFRAIQRLVESEITTHVMEGFEPVQKASPAKKPGGNGRRGAPNRGNGARAGAGRGAPRSGQRPGNGPQQRRGGNGGQRRPSGNQ